MTHVSVKLTIKELTLLANLAADQLFRREFIDPKMPGQKLNPFEIQLGKTLVARLRSLREPVPIKKPGSTRKVHAL